MSITYRGTMLNNECRFYITDATEIIQEVSEKTTYSPTAIAALGRSMMITSILGLMQKDDAKVSTIIEGGGNIGKIVCDANTLGEVKGKVDNPLVNPPKITDTKLNVGEAVGNAGFLRVIKDLNLKEPFVGEVPLISGEIGIDYANYFVASEQVPTAIAVGVLIDTDHSIKDASCFIVQPMPDASDETINKLEKFFSDFTSISSIMKDMTEIEFLDKYFPDNYEILKEIETSFKCNCSYNKFLNALRMLPPSDIIDLKKDKTIECVCDFCYKAYDIKSVEI